MPLKVLQRGDGNSSQNSDHRDADNNANYDYNKFLHALISAQSTQLTQYQIIEFSFFQCFNR